MKAPGIRLTLLTAIAIFATPAVAPAAYLVPPENSAATQYTEAYPTARGNRDVDGGQQHRKASPKQVLGDRNARKLEARGPEGEAAAELAAATAPSADALTAEGGGSADEDTAAGAGGSANGGGSLSGNGDDARGGSAQRQDSPASEGSSPIGEVLGQATGATPNGGTGLLLPLAIVAAIAWAFAYLWRQRKRQTV